MPKKDPRDCDSRLGFINCLDPDIKTERKMLTIILIYINVVLSFCFVLVKLEHSVFVDYCTDFSMIMGAVWEVCKGLPPFFLNGSGILHPPQSIGFQVFVCLFHRARRH